MRGPKTVVLALLRDLAYDQRTREHLGITLEELTQADRWANAMPAWAEDLQPESVRSRYEQNRDVTP